MTNSLAHFILSKIFTQAKGSRKAAFQRVDKCLHAGQTDENRGRFCENGLVGVRWYGRDRFHRKRITPAFLIIFGAF